MPRSWPDPASRCFGTAPGRSDEPRAGRQAGGVARQLCRWTLARRPIYRRPPQFAPLFWIARCDCVGRRSGAECMVSIAPGPCGGRAARQRRRGCSPGSSRISAARMKAAGTAIGLRRPGSPRRRSGRCGSRSLRLRAIPARSGSPAPRARQGLGACRARQRCNQRLAGHRWPIRLRGSALLTLEGPEKLPPSIPRKPCSPSARHNRLPQSRWRRAAAGPRSLPTLPGRSLPPPGPSFERRSRRPNGWTSSRRSPARSRTSRSSAAAGFRPAPRLPPSLPSIRSSSVANSASAISLTCGSGPRRRSNSRTAPASMAACVTFATKRRRRPAPFRSRSRSPIPGARSRRA